MRVYLKTSNDSIVNQEMEKIASLRNGKGVYLNIKEAHSCLKLKDGKDIYLFGDVFYYIKKDGNIKLVNSDSRDYLTKIFSEYNLKDVITRLEGQYIGIYVDDRMVRIFSDRYARVDCFYASGNSDFYLATDLDFIFKHVTPEYDQKMLAHLFSVYGWYTPKGLTIYKNVKQLKVGEILTVSDPGIVSEVIEFTPLEIEEYGDKDLEAYYRILREAITARANRRGKTWVSSSSGWDSSTILGMLVDEFGSKNVGMMTGSAEYSDGTETVNKFEIGKVKKIGEYYGIKPLLVNLDFKSKQAPEYWKRSLPYYRSKHMYSYVTYNYAKGSDALYNAAGEGQVVFHGEASDSFHNFGFAQFATFFHTKKSFTEYADKMNCYLYGPSFLKKVIDGSYEKDKVYQIFKKMADGVEFMSAWKRREDAVEGYLFPFFHGSPRIPFAKTYENPLWNKEGKQAIYHFPFREYMPKVLSGLTEKNIYSWLIYLYHSFHTQGSTTNIHKHGMELNNHLWRMPFNDYRLITFLSKAPEKWGRGLEFANTKYPLKWVARNKIRFPYELLEEGPHSYLYDVIEGFSPAAEITYRSGVTNFFKDALATRSYKNIITDEYFDMQYLDRLVTDYLDGKETKGKDFNNLVSLITLAITGWY